MADDQIIDPFNIGVTLKEQNKTATGRAAKADDVLTHFMESQDQRDAQREANAKELVAAKTEVANQVATETQNFVETAKPIFQKREAIADRNAQIEEMNPFKRGLVNMFSFNNNQTRLAARDRAYAGQLSALGQDYQTNLGAHDTILKSVDTAYEAKDSLIQLEGANEEQDVRLAVQSYGSSQQMFNTSLEALNAEGAVLRAKSQARIDWLSGAMPQDINSALALAKKNGGTAIVNGVELREGELRDAQMGWEEKQLALESRNLAIKSQRMDIAQQQEQRLITHMTKPELEAAIQSGGVYKGQRLNQGLLTQAYGASQERQRMIVNDAGMQGGINTAISMIGAVANNATQSNARAGNLFGMVPKEMEASSRSIAARLDAYTEGQRRATANGAGAEFAAANLPQFQAMLKEQSMVIDKMAEKWSGGDKDLKAVATSWLTGSPLNNAQATTGLIKMARNGIPAGTKLSGPAAATLAKVKGIVEKHAQSSPGDAVDFLGRKLNLKKGEEDPELIALVQKSIGQSYNATTMDSVIKATPQIAATVRGPDGGPHPFAKVNPHDFYAAIQAGDDAGFKLVGQQLGLRPEQARILFAQGPSSPVWSDVKKKNPEADFAKLGAQLATAQNQATLQALDAGPSATAGFRPSRAYVDLLMNPQFQQRVSQAVQGQSQSTAGDFLVGTIAGQGFDNSFYNYAQSIPRSYAALEAQASRQAQERAATIRSTNPWDSTSMALGTVPNVTPQDQQRLLAAVKEVVNKGASRHPEAGTGPNGITPGHVTSAMIDSVIMNHEFEDPNLERVRKTAARDWVATRHVTDGALERLVNTAMDVTGYNTMGLDSEDRR